MKYKEPFFGEGGGMEISKMFEFLDNLYLLKKKKPLDHLLENILA